MQPKVTKRKRDFERLRERKKKSFFNNRILGLWSLLVNDRWTTVHLCLGTSDECDPINYLSKFWQSVKKACSTLQTLC